MTRAFRQYAATAWMEAGGHINDSVLFIADYVLRLARVVVLLSLWRVLMAGHGSVSGMTLATLLTYTLIAESFAEQLEARTYIEHMLWEGKLATLFLQPMGLVQILTGQSLGRWLTGFAFFSAPLLLAAPLLGVNPLPASWSAGGLFLISLALAISVGLAVDLAFSSLIVLLNTNLWVISRLRGAVAALLSGAVLPLALLPWGLGRVFDWLPFASMASAPLRIYVGTGRPLLLMLTQLVWAIVLWPFVLWLWRVNRERLACYGG